MNECEKHPGTEGVFFCAKYTRHLCEKCMDCGDPELYCKFRQRCLIWEYVKHGAALAD